MERSTIMQMCTSALPHTNELYGIRDFEFPFN